VLGTDTDPDPAKCCGSDPIWIRIYNTANGVYSKECHRCFLNLASELLIVHIVASKMVADNIIGNFSRARFDGRIHN